MSTLSIAKRKELAQRARAYAERLTDDEDAALTTAAKADPDSGFRESGGRTAFLIDVDPGFVGTMRKVRGRQVRPTKAAVSLRLDPDVVEHYRATGPGWQGRVNAALRKAAGL